MRIYATEKEKIIIFAQNKAELKNLVPFADISGTVCCDMVVPITALRLVPIRCYRQYMKKWLKLLIRMEMEEHVKK